MKRSKKSTGNNTSVLLIFLVAVLFVQPLVNSSDEEPVWYSSHADCNDGIDNDFDGYIDTDDPECWIEGNWTGEDPSPGI